MCTLLQAASCQLCCGQICVSRLLLLPLPLLLHLLPLLRPHLV
jgi:hypothetical protein